MTIAKDKAYTAAVFGASTDDLSNALKDNPVLHHGIAIRPGVVLFGGGLPIVEDGAVIGAIGVSGGSEDDDRACARLARGGARRARDRTRRPGVGARLPPWRRDAACDGAKYRY